jgi:hypothetical protein
VTESDESPFSALEKRAFERFAPLSLAERSLLMAASNGEIIDFGPHPCEESHNENRGDSDESSADYLIRADLIRWLYVDRGVRDLVDPRGFRVHGASITGKLDLAYVVLPHSLSLTGCRIVDELDLTSVEAPFINLSETRLLFLNAESATVKGNMLLRGVRASDTVRLASARIGGNLECDGGKFHGRPKNGTEVSGIALDIRNAKVTGDVQLRYGFSAQGMVRLAGAEIGGALDCAGGEFNNPAAPGNADGDISLQASGAKIGGTVRLSDGFTARGMVRLKGAHIGGNLFCEKGTFQNLPQSETTGNWFAIEVTNAEVSGDVLLRRKFKAEGIVELYGAEIGGSLDCSGGTFQNPDRNGVPGSGYALGAINANVAGNVFFDGLSVQGRIRLKGVQIRGSLEFKACSLERLSLVNASVGTVSIDKKESWPPDHNLLVDGFIYQRMSGVPTNALDGLEWLARQESFTVQPYRQFAKFLNQEGDDRGSRQVLVEMEKRARQGRGWRARSTSWLLRVTIGYGYFSLRALGWLLALVLLGCIVYQRAYTRGEMIPTNKEVYDEVSRDNTLPANYEPFSPLPYSLENSFPLVKLGVAEQWTPKHDGQRVISQPSGWISLRFLEWFRWGQVCLGWVLTTLFVAGVTGIVRKS